MTRSGLLLGMDGGGTSTVAWLANLEGDVLGRGRAGPSNIKAIGPDAARESLDRSIGLAFDDAGLEAGPVAVSCLGLAGFDRPADRQWLQEWAGRSRWSGRLVLVNDGDLVVAAGTPDGWGVGVIAGTGSIAVGRGPDGRSSRAGGWGYVFGDEGSGYSVAVAGLRRVAQCADGRRPGGAVNDPLTARVCQALGIDGPSELVAAVYRQEVDRARLASLAPSVVAASADDPSIIREILEPAGFELARMVRASALEIGLEPGPLPLAMAGSFLLNSPPVSKVLIDQLTAWGYQVQARAVREPAEGAVILARRTLT